MVNTWVFHSPSLSQQNTWKGPKQTAHGSTRKMKRERKAKERTLLFLPVDPERHSSLRPRGASSFCKEHSDCREDSTTQGKFPMKTGPKTRWAEASDLSNTQREMVAVLFKLFRKKKKKKKKLNSLNKANLILILNSNKEGIAGNVKVPTNLTCEYWSKIENKQQEEPSEVLKSYYTVT